MPFKDERGIIDFTFTANDSIKVYNQISIKPISNSIILSDLAEIKASPGDSINMLIKGDNSKWN